MISAMHTTNRQSFRKVACSFKSGWKQIKCNFFNDNGINGINEQGSETDLLGNDDRPTNQPTDFVSEGVNEWVIEEKASYNNTYTSKMMCTYVFVWDTNKSVNMKEANGCT